ncbi:hypothetical protein [Spiribacter insolitus]|uniref:Uncharacterized protein n=1 Tax=Spiribacter insolitus TaxID=3122417 RepID=A0ABV3T5B6_9GAMM
MDPVQDDELNALTALGQAVADALERKRRLGQYAVVWRDGRAVKLSPEEIGSAEADTSQAGPGAAR